MHRLNLWILFSSLALGSVACQGGDDDADSNATSPNGGSAATRPRVTQVTPPVDIKTPPDDAAKTASGLIYKVLTANPAGPQPTRSDATLVNYTGWRQRTGETFFTTKGSGRPITLDLVHSAPAFAEALQLLHAGERMVLWVPPTATAPEVLVYEIELTQIVKPQVARQSPKPEQAAPKADVGTATAATTEAAAAKPLQR